MVSHYRFSSFDGMSDFIVAAESVEEAAAASIDSGINWLKNYKIINMESGEVLNSGE